jgi:hypothetical protein
MTLVNPWGHGGDSSLWGQGWGHGGWACVHGGHEDPGSKASLGALAWLT